MQNPALRSRSFVAVVFVGAALVVAACGGSTSSSGTGGTPAGSGGGAGAINATESDFKIDVTSTSAAAGPVTFHVTNSGSQVHEFVVVKTDLAPDQLPQDSADQTVDEDASGLTIVDEVEDLAVGASSDLSVTLEPGKYVLICNVPTHYSLGMHTAFTVN